MMKGIINFKKYSIFPKKKIKGICGPHGSGKSTTLLSSKYSNIIKTCYFNIKAMENNKNNITIWKQNLLLFELYNLFKKGDKSNFGEIKKLIKISINYWEGIIQSIKFCVKKKINCVFIIDQYKEELDKEFINLKNLKEIIEDKDNNFVKLLISSSINHKDIRNFLLLKYLNVGIPSIIDYEYIDELFNIEEIPNYLQDFSDSQKNLYMENFKGMSTYYFHISEFKEEEKNISSMNNIKKKEEEKINMQIEEFYKNNSNN